MAATEAGECRWRLSRPGSVELASTHSQSSFFHRSIAFQEEAGTALGLLLLAQEAAWPAGFASNLRLGSKT